jgi:CO/xanthine dehydrogenase FAD-binding subunit
MKPSLFDYYQVQTIDAAVELLDQYGDDVKVLSGGQSLIPMMNFRMARPKVLVDISKLNNFNSIEESGNLVSVSATTRQAYTEKSLLIQSELPVLCEAIRHIGHIQIRNKGTIGGSIVHADPASELPAVSLVLDAEFEIANKTGRHQINAEELFITYMTTSLQPNEMLTNIHFKKPPKGSGWGFHEIAIREGDFALAGSIAVIGTDALGICNHARIALFGVDATPIRVKEAEDLLIGESYSEELLQEASEKVKVSIDPESDVHASSDYRRKMAGILTLRSLKDAYGRVQS